MPLPDQMTVCPQCNHKIPEDSAFCQVCGTKLSSATVTTQSDENLRQMFSKVEKWEMMGFCRVADRSALQMTEQQRQERLEKNIQSAQDIAIKNRITVTEAENKKKRIIKIVVLSILAVTLAAYTVSVVLLGIHN